jgi:hypothetical protein
MFAKCEDARDSIRIRAPIQRWITLSQRACTNCEGLFSRNGENYVMTLVAQQGERFRSPTCCAQFRQRKLPPTSIGTTRRRFLELIGKSWAISLSVCSGEPRSILRNVALHVVVCTDALSQDMFYPPSRGRKKDYTTYTFQARGLNFLMRVGKRIPDAIRHSCTVSGPDQWITSRSCEDKTRQAEARLRRH